MTTVHLAHEVRGPRSSGTPPLVLLHAYPLDRTMWRPVADLLPGERCVLVDLPGCGDSPLPDGDPSLELSAQGVLTVLDALGVERAVVAGVSMGGYVAMRMAERAPQRIAGLALVDTKADADADAARRTRLEVAEAVSGPEGLAAVAGMPSVLLGETTRRERPELVADVSRRIASARAEGLAWSQRAMAGRPDSNAVLDALGVPVAIVVGEEDVPTPPAAAAAMAARLRDAVLTPVAGSGHLTPLEAPAAVAAALTALLVRV